MAVIIRQYGGSEDLIRLHAGDVVILKSPGGSLYAKAVQGLACSDCFLDAENLSAKGNACIKYRLLCTSEEGSVGLKLVDPEQIVEELM